jgi:hypothetical protein
MDWVCWHEELGFEQVWDGPQSVGVHRLVGDPLPFAPGLPLFTFQARE